MKNEVPTTLNKDRFPAPLGLYQTRFSMQQDSLLDPKAPTVELVSSAEVEVEVEVGDVPSNHIDQ